MTRRHIFVEKSVDSRTAVGYFFCGDADRQLGSRFLESILHYKMTFGLDQGSISLKGYCAMKSLNFLDISAICSYELKIDFRPLRYLDGRLGIIRIHNLERSSKRSMFDDGWYCWPGIRVDANLLSISC